MTTHEPGADTQTERDALDSGGHEGRGAGTARAAARTEREQRRQVVATLIGYHWTYEEIAARVGVSKGTIASDVVVIRERWRDRYVETYDAHVAEELAKLDALERRILPIALTGGARSGDESPKPSLWAVDRQLAIMDRRARLLGLDKPTKITAKIEVVESTLLDDQIRALLEEMQQVEALSEPAALPE